MKLARLSFTANGYTYNAIRTLSALDLPAALANKTAWETACAKAHDAGDLAQLSELHCGVVKLDDSSGLSQNCDYEDIVAGAFVRGSAISIGAYHASRPLLLEAELLTNEQVISISKFLYKVKEDKRLQATGVSRLNDEVRLWMRKSDMGDSEPLFSVSSTGTLTPYRPAGVSPLEPRIAKSKSHQPSLGL